MSGRAYVVTHCKPTIGREETRCYFTMGHVLHVELGEGEGWKELLGREEKDVRRKGRGG
jgi:hypothetical protein